MTLIVPDENPTGLSTSVTCLLRQLADLREDLEQLQDRIRAGDFDDLKNSTRAISDIRQWLRIALEMEISLEQRNKRSQGIVHDYALDFDAARASIGCRLDRLRRSGCPKRVLKCSG